MDIKLIININTDNSAFDDYSKEIKRILNNIVEKLSTERFKTVQKYDTNNTWSITDINGNKVGSWNFKRSSDE